MSHLIFGCGYLGRRVAARWIDQGKSVAAVTRDEAKAANLASVGLTPVVADLTQPETLTALAKLPLIETVLFAVGFDRNGDQSIHDVYVDGMRNTLAALPGTVRRFVYISTTGVYGETNGDSVDESTPCTPNRAGGKASLAAEQLLQGHAATAGKNFQPVVLRMAGLYGPDRVPLQAKLAAGQPLPTTPEGTINLIHIDDAANVAVAAAAAENVSQLYTVSDGHPVIRRDFYGEVARLLAVEPPTFDPPTADENSRRAAGRGKRVQNNRLLDELPVKLAFPTYREGLAAILG